MSIAIQLNRIDWSAPWWQPWRAVGQHVAQQIIQGGTVAAALNAALKRPTAGHYTAHSCPKVQFVAQSALPEGAAYEAFIYDTGCVPTRENLHDFFNGLVWLVFPLTKRRLNQLQAGEINAHGVRTTRGALRDALTLFDENAALWPLSGSASAELIDALRAKHWQHACVSLRAHWSPSAPVLFGHALLEKLVTPYKSITAHVFTVPGSIDCSAELVKLGQVGQVKGDLTNTHSLDALTAAHLSPDSLVPKPFIPLPVLGVPGWWAENAHSAFYQDDAVFRLPRCAT